MKLGAVAGVVRDSRPIERRIAALREALTESEERLARVVLETQGRLASFTAAELAERALVSNATAARFFQRLGYSNFGEARRQAREVYWASPLLGLEAATDSDFARHVENDRRNLAMTAAALPDAMLRQAVDILAAARTVWVLGFRNSMALAVLARALLITAKEDVRLLPQAGMTLGEDLVGLGPGQAVLAVGFRRRPPVLRELMATAKRAGVPSILLADDSADVSARLASVVLRCAYDGGGMYDSYAAAVSVLNYLVTCVAVQLGPRTADRLRRIEEMHLQLRAFEGPGEAKLPKRRVRRVGEGP